jgi:hypothetical protein
MKTVIFRKIGRPTDVRAKGLRYRISACQGKETTAPRPRRVPKRSQPKQAANVLLLA